MPTNDSELNCDFDSVDNVDMMDMKPLNINEPTDEKDWSSELQDTTSEINGVVKNSKLTLNSYVAVFVNHLIII